MLAMRQWYLGSWCTRYRAYGAPHVLSWWRPPSVGGWAHRGNRASGEIQSDREPEISADSCGPWVSQQVWENFWAQNIITHQQYFMYSQQVS